MSYMFRLYLIKVGISFAVAFNVGTCVEHPTPFAIGRAVFIFCIFVITVSNGDN